MIIAVVSAIAESVKLGREAAAAQLEEIAEKIRAGQLIPDAAFAQAKDDVDRFDGWSSGATEEVE